MTTGQDIVNAAYLVKGAPYRTWEWGSPIPMWMYDGQGDPPSAEHIMYAGVMCSDLVSWALEMNGLPACYGTEYLAYYLESQQPFDPSTPGEPGAICLRPYSGPALADQGHVAIYVDEHTLIQSLYTPGVTDAYTDAETYSWGGSTEFTTYGYLPGVDYGNSEPTREPLKSWQAKGYLDLRGVYIPGTQGERDVWGDISEDGSVTVRDWSDEGE